MVAYLVSRHPGTREWAEKLGVEATHINHLDPTIIRHGDLVYGTLPADLVAEVCHRGARYFHLSVDVSDELRGRELSAAELTRLGARFKEIGMARLTPEPGKRQQLWQQIKDLWHDVWPALLLVAGVVLLPRIWAGVKYFSQIGRNIADHMWLADNLLNFVMVTLVTSAITLGVQSRREKRRIRKYSGWTIQLKGLPGIPEDEGEIYWQEAEKFDSGEFEYWKFIKSTVGNFCFIRTPNLAGAYASGWLRDNHSRNPNDAALGDRIIIDFAAMREDDVADWKVDDLPATWKWNNRADRRKGAAYIGHSPAA